MSSVRTKYWCFTLNNYNEEEMSALSVLATEESQVKYMVIGKEVGDNGTRHLQCYVEFSNRQRFTSAKRLLGQRVHLEARRGTAQEASDYCKKDGDFVEHGVQTVSRQGSRTDLESLRNDLELNKSMKEISTDHFEAFLKYRRSIYAFRSLHAIQRNWVCSVVVYWGRTGTGKTRSVVDNATDLWIHPGGDWFDGYDNHKQVLFDEFSGSSFKLQYLLQLLDRYPMRVPIKGDFVSWCPEEIYITSNIDPESWYNQATFEHVRALFRRITNIVHFE